MLLNLTKFRLLVFGLTLILLALPAFAQPKPEAPFKIGESATFEAKFSRTLVPPLTVGDLFFSVLAAPEGSKGSFLIKGEAKSRGIVKLFGSDIAIKVESTVDNDKFRVLKTVKHDVQGDRVRDSEATFDYRTNRVSYIETDPKDPARRPYQLAGSIPEIAHDVLSGIYSLRLIPLSVGKTFELTVSDSGLVYTVPVRVTARERQKNIEKKVWTYKIEPEIFGEKRPFPGKGKLTIWLTEDAQRIPVRALLNFNLGKVDIRLKKYVPGTN